MKNTTSELTIGHIIVKVSDLQVSCQFYTNLGLPPHRTTERIASIELFGGTDLLLLKASAWTDEDMQTSLTGQFRLSFSEQFDFMIPGRSRQDLEVYRNTLIDRGLSPEEIPNKTFYGHHVFCIKDPDGHGITIYTSHRQ
jgi:catechol 2,3-dioxygenase-like lactoylglutathione lyase family enzyme